MPLREEPEVYEAKIARLEEKLRAAQAELQAARTDCAAQLTEMRLGNARIIRALDCSVQLIEALLVWMPEGMALSDKVKLAKGAWSCAMQEIRK